MPRNASGQYTLPVGNPVVADTLIESDGWANPTMEDLGAEIEDSLSRDGKGSMRAALGVIDGSEANPGMRFLAETGSGLYRDSDGIWWLTVKGVGIIRVSEITGIQIDANLEVTGDTIFQGTLVVNGAGGLTVAPLRVFGVADEVQAIIRGDAGQGENLLEFQDDVGNILGWVEADGRPNWLISATPGSGNTYRFENDDIQVFRVKSSAENAGGSIEMADVIDSSAGTNYVAEYSHGANVSADFARVSLKEQTGGGNVPGLAWETSQAGDYNRAHVKRLSGAQTANLHEWRDEAGAVMAAIDKDGNFIGGPGGGGGGGQTPNNTGNVPVGAILMWPLDPPSLGVEWLICDGSSQLTASFPALFAYLGYAYGGAGASFTLPDYRGEFVRGQDKGRGLDPEAGTRTDRGDGTTGDAPGTNQPQDINAVVPAPHTHLYLGVTGGGLSGGGGFAGGFTPTGPAVGAGGGIETRPVNIYSVMAIKAV